MPYNPQRHHRRSIRLRDYDYTQPGTYFITICTHQRRHSFDEPALRQIAEQQWRALARAGERGALGARIELDEWVVMPNHMHGIIVIVEAARPLDAGERPAGQLGINVAPGSIGAIVRSYKAAVTRRINALQEVSGEHIWQRGYYERIIRDERQLENTRRYILDNPRRWAEDRDNLDALLARMAEKS